MSILINENAPRVHYIATSGQKNFVVPFEWFSDADLKVFVNEEQMTFSAPPLNASQYSATGEGVTGGGYISFGTPGRMVSDEVIIVRDMPIARTSDLPTTGAFPVAALNDTFDAQTAMIQQTEVNVEKRTLRMAMNDFVEVLKPLPDKLGRAGRYLAFDYQGQPILVAPGAAPGDAGGGGIGLLGRIWTGDIPPPAPYLDGMLWWDSTTGTLFVWYDDESSSQWVQVNIATGSMGAPPPPVPAQLSFVQTTLLVAPSGEWIKDLDCRYYRIRATGGGGGAGGCRTTTTTFAAAGGGGSGAYGESPWLNASSISGATFQCGVKGTGAIGTGANDAATGSKAATPGGATVWNDGIRSWTFFGGGVGASSGGSAAPYVRAGGTAGTLASTLEALLGYGGVEGESGIAFPTSMLGGHGGGNPLGQGGARAYILTGNSPGIDASHGYGGGGGGAVRFMGATGNVQGGDGRPGCIYVDQMF